MLMLPAWAGFVSAQETSDRGFIHPGGLHTQEDFDRVKAQIAAGNKTVKAAFQKLTSSEYSQASVQTYPTEIIVRGGGNGENYMNATGGSPDSTPLTDSSPRPRGTQLLEASQL